MFIIWNVFINTIILNSPGYLDMRRIKKNLAIGLSLGLALVFGSTGHATAPRDSALVVSIDAKQLPLSEVLNEASRQTGWTILVDERLIGKQVSGSFENIALESLLRRSLRGEPHVVQYDEGSRRVDIRSFRQPGGVLTIAANSHAEESEDSEKIKAMRIEEQKAYEAFISNPNSIEPTSGMTLGELAALQAEEQKAYEAYLANPDSIEPTSGMKLKDIAALHAEEEKLYAKYKSNPDSVEPMTGMTLGEVDAMNKEQ